jgi:hypothetical protein
MSRARGSRSVEQTDGQTDVPTDETEIGSVPPPEEPTPTPSVSIRRKDRPRKGRPSSDRKRVTVELTHKLDQILTWISDRRGIEKYDLIFGMVQAGARRYEEYEACEKFWDETMCQTVRAG